ncbi:hypothetical protein Bhyg_14945, partial [Pseudolycoriella hygida]
QATGQHQQIINANNQQQATVTQQQVQVNLQSQQQLTNQQVILQKSVTNIQQSPQGQQPIQQIDQQSPQHQNAPSPQNQINARMQYQQYLQQQQTIQQIKMQQQVGSNNQQNTLVTNQQQQMPQQLMQSPTIQSPLVQSTQQQVAGQPPQKIQIQNQIIVQQQQPGLVQSNQNANILVNQQAGQQQQAGLIIGANQTQWTQQNTVQPQQQFIRTNRPQWPGQANQPQRQLIHLDAATHAHLQTLDPIRRAEYLSKLQLKQRERSLMLRQQAFQARPNAPNIVAGQRPASAQHIIVRSQVPAGMTQYIARGGAPGLSPISQQAVTPIPQHFVDPNTS